MSARPSTVSPAACSWTHIERRAYRQARFGDPISARAVDRARDAEIGEHRVAVREQNVRRLDVAMHEAARVGIAECACDLGGDAYGVRNRERAFVRVRRPSSDSPSTYGIV